MSFASRVAAQNRRMEKAHDRATARWADKIVAKEEAKARGARTCSGCGAGVRKVARYCEGCGEELTDD